MRNFKFAWLLSLLTVFSLSFALTSCGDDDDDVTVTPTAADIVGIWHGTQISINIGGQIYTEDDSQQYYQFLENGKCYDILEDNGLYSVDVVNWSLNGNTLTIDGEKSTVQSFDSNHLVIYSEGTEGGISYTGTESFKREFVLPPDVLKEISKQ